MCLLESHGDVKGKYFVTALLPNHWCLHGNRKHLVANAA